MKTPGLRWPVLTGLVLIVCSIGNAAITHDFAANPITWDATLGSMTFDANGDTIDDFAITVVTGFTDAGGQYVVDPISTSSGNIEKTFQFSITALDPTLTETTFDSFGFDVFSIKESEPGFTGGAGSATLSVFDDANNELVNAIAVSGNINNASIIPIPGSVTSSSFTIKAVTSNNNAQVRFGNFVFNAGTVTASSPIVAAVPESGSLSFAALALACCMTCRRRRR